MINITANPKVLFEDESCVVSWNVSNANCVESGTKATAGYLLADPTKPSGTKQDGSSIGAGASLLCTDPKCMNGTWTIGQAHKQHHYWKWVKADNVLEKTASASQWVDILSIPKFTGAYTTPYAGFSTRQAGDQGYP